MSCFLLSYLWASGGDGGIEGVVQSFIRSLYVIRNEFDLNTETGI